MASVCKLMWWVCRRSYIINISYLFCDFLEILLTGHIGSQEISRADNKSGKRSSVKSVLALACSSFKANVIIFFLFVICMEYIILVFFFIIQELFGYIYIYMDMKPIVEEDAQVRKQELLELVKMFQ